MTTTEQTKLPVSAVMIRALHGEADALASVFSTEPAGVVNRVAKALLCAARLLAKAEEHSPGMLLDAQERVQIILGLVTVARYANNQDTVVDLAEYLEDGIAKLALLLTSR